MEDNVPIINTDEKLLNEAIEHCYEVASTCNNAGCSSDHEQLAKWLTELKKYRAYFKNKVIE